jgi:hypothetical protein
MGPVEVGLILLWLIMPVTISVLKGRYVLAALVLVSPIFPIVAACRLAKPGTWWARRYGYAKLRRSWERHECTPYQPAERSA